MKTKFIFITILLCLCSSNIFGQKLWYYLNTNIDNKVKKPYYILPIIDELSANTAIFVKHKKFISASLCNKNQEYFYWNCNNEKKR